MASAAAAAVVVVRVLVGFNKLDGSRAHFGSQFLLLRTNLKAYSSSSLCIFSLGKIRHVIVPAERASLLMVEKIALTLLSLIFILLFFLEKSKYKLVDYYLKN